MDTNWFQARKKALKVSDRKIGDLIGKDRSVVSRMLRDEVRFDNASADGLAKALNVSREEILKRAGVLRHEVQPCADDPAEAGPSDTITISLENLSVFLGAVLNVEQDDLFSPDELLSIARKLQSAIEEARKRPETLSDPRLWATFLHGYVAPKPIDRPRA